MFIIDIFNVIGQGLTFIGYMVSWVSRYSKTKKSMLIGDNISGVISIIAFMFLGTYDGIKNAVFVVVRSAVSNKVKEKSKKLRFVVFIIMLLVLILLYAPNILRVSTMCVFICSVLNLYGVVMCKEQGIRIFGFIGSVFYSMFLLFTGNYTGFICQLIGSIVLITSYCKYRKEG